MTLSVYCVLTAPLVEWPGSVVRFGFEAYAKAVVFFFFTVLLTTNERRLRWLLVVFLICQSLRVLEPLYLHATTGYWGGRASIGDGAEFMNRLSGAPSDVINPNGLAFVVLTVICFAHYLWTESWCGRLAYMAVLPLFLYALVLTGSRSGLITLCVVFAAMWLRSRHKMMLALVALAVLALSLPRLSSDMSDRYRSVVDSSTKNARTAQGRLEGIRSNLEVAARRPLFGHGLGTSREANANFGHSDQPAHNLIVEVAEELGFLGLGVFVWFLWSVAKALVVNVKRWRYESSPTIARVGGAVQIFMFMNVVFSLASYGLTGYSWYFLAGLTEALGRLDKDARPRPTYATVLERC